MNIAIVHYHLNRGGVTQVVMNHLRALETVASSSGDVRVALIYGGRQDGLSENFADTFASVKVSRSEVASLEYDDGREPNPQLLVDDLRRALRELDFQTNSTLLHVHNHSLGKNLSMPEALVSLADDGYRMLLHIHDFAEDFRPDNYRRMAESLTDNAAGDLPSLLYPQAEQIHYAALNRRDLNVLGQAGVDPRRLHFLPNPVGDFGELPDRDEARRKLHEKYQVPTDNRYLLYPVRGIRRKNLGEAVLWSVLAEPGTTVGFTLAPQNPVERPSYDRWKEFARSLELPCVFETGDEGGMSFLENLAAADQILTTSIAEGFGLVFLESWLAGKKLVGRNLPEITADFVASGIALDHLSPSLTVPVDWIGADTISQALYESYTAARDSFGLPPTADDEFANQFDQLIERGTIDFARLNSEFQRTVIRLVNRDTDLRDRLRELNPWVSSSPDADDQSLNANNAAVVRKEYSLEVAGKRLLEIYESVMASDQSPVTGPPDGNKVLASFLDLSRLHLIRLEA